jgi:N-formylglutamate deformylase
LKLYNLYLPLAERYPLIASIPHSGTYIPRKIRNQFMFDPGPVLAPVDWYLDKLYDFLPGLGATVIQATHSRYVVNLNRDLQPPLFGPEPLSVVPDNTCFGRPLYNRDPEQSEVEERIKRFYLPYHRRLAGILDEMVREYGRVYLLDLHGYYRGPPVDVCLGNCNETTCSERLIGGFERLFLKYYFNVTRNEVWTGGHITRYYGNTDSVESLQIELWFPSYLDGRDFGEEEVPQWDSEKFREAKERLRRVFADVIKELFPPTP